MTEKVTLTQICPLFACTGKYSYFINNNLCADNWTSSSYFFLMKQNVIL
jgi:hypothetical protein